MIRTKEDYVKSLQEQGHVVYSGGKKAGDVIATQSLSPISTARP